MFIREKILSLKNDLNTLTLFRNDKKYLFDRDFKNVLKSLEKNENFLVSIGELIDNKLNCTISKKYYKILIWVFWMIYIRNHFCIAKFFIF